MASRTRIAEILVHLCHHDQRHNVDVVVHTDARYPNTELAAWADQLLEASYSPGSNRSSTGGAPASSPADPTAGTRSASAAVPSIGGATNPFGG